MNLLRKKIVASSKKIRCIENKGIKLVFFLKKKEWRAQFQMSSGSMFTIFESRIQQNII